MLQPGSSSPPPASTAEQGGVTCCCDSRCCTRSLSNDTPADTEAANASVKLIVSPQHVYTDLLEATPTPLSRCRWPALLLGLLLLLLLLWAHTDQLVAQLHLVSTTSLTVQRTAIAFLTYRPSKQTIGFAGEVGRSGKYDVFIVADDNAWNRTATEGVTYIQYQKRDCYRAGYTQSSFSEFLAESAIFGMPLNAWDKALYHFGRVERSHRFVWLVEEDVFIPSVTAIDLAYHEGADVITAAPQRYDEGQGKPYGWHWADLEDYGMSFPWYKHSSQAVGVGRRLFDALDELARTNGRLFYLEMLFGTVAMHNNQMHISLHRNGASAWIAAYRTGFLTPLCKGLLHGGIQSRTRQSSK